MVDLSSLKKLFDIDISPTIKNIQLINIEKETKVVQETDELKVNLQELDDEEREEVIDITRGHFREEGRVLRDSVEDDTEHMELGWDEKKKEILDFFEGLIYPYYLTILEKSLYLRSLIERENLSKHEIDERKNQMADRLGGEAHYIANLCSSGYFDESRTFREIYQQMYLGDEYEEHEFKDVFQELVQEKLVCVFIERDMTVYEATQEVRGRLARYQKEDPPNDYIDVRGIGDECREIINGVVENLDNEFISFDYTPWNDGDQKVIRIHPDSLPPIGSN